jgi:hypothetical protein
MSESKSEKTSVEGSGSLLEHKPTWERRINEAKLKHRPQLSDWAGEHWATERINDWTELCDVRAYQSTKNIDRIDCNNLSIDEFIRLYEQPAIPCVINGIPQQEGWKAISENQWTDWNWLRTHLGDRMFKVGEDDDGYKVKVKAKYFFSYLQNNKDDSPLYVFDSTFDDDKVSSCLLHSYSVPSYFRDDLFSLVGEDRRPPYRWWLCGPKRSGTCVHIDPLGTSAWNTVIVGRKRWVIFPPTCSKKIVKALSVIKDGEDDEAINYFVDHLPRLIKQIKRDERKWKDRQRQPGGPTLCTHCSELLPHGHSSSSASSNSSSNTDGITSSDSSRSSTSTSTGTSSDKSIPTCSSCGGQRMENPSITYGCSSDQIIEFTQYPGETIFVPGSWWHAVINLDDTVAITQNFCSKTNFVKVWRETRVGRKKMSCKWLKRLRETFPLLAETAEKVNEEDNFLMYYERRRLKATKREEKKERKQKKKDAKDAAAAAQNSNSKLPAPEVESSMFVAGSGGLGSGSSYSNAKSCSSIVSDNSNNNSFSSPSPSNKQKQKSNYKHESKHDARKREAAKRKLDTGNVRNISDDSDSSSQMSGLTTDSDTSSSGSEPKKRKSNKVEK